MFSLVNRQASLGKNEMVTMLDLNPLLTVFPLLLSFNFCVSSPLITPQVRHSPLITLQVGILVNCSLLILPKLPIYQIGAEVAEDNAVVDNIENE